jgi:hypothetical protein
LLIVPTKSLAILKAFVPDNLIIAIPETPGGVDKAYIVILNS